MLGRKNGLDTFSDTQTLCRPGKYGNVTCCFSNTAFLFGSDIIRFRRFGAWCIQSHLSLFPITSWGIFMSLKPSAKACQLAGSLPFRCLMTSLTKSIILDPGIDLPYSLTVQSSSQDMFELFFSGETKGLAHYL